MTTLAGRVLIEGDDPSIDAVVELHNAGGDVVDQVQVDSTGGFRFHVSPGSWSLRSWDPHGHRGTAEASLSEGEAVRIDLRLLEVSKNP